MSPDLRAFLVSWEWDPTVLIGLALGAWLYARGWRRLRRRGRGGRWLKPWRAWCYYIGLGFVFLALLSPIDTYDSLFFTMHMIEHLLLIMFAAPFIWLGAPLLPILWAFPREGRRRLGRIFRRDHPVHRVFRWLTSAPIALTIYVLTLVIWHFPGPYDAAQGRTLVHDLEHISFLAAALIFWWPVIHPTGGQRRLSYGMAILYLFPAKIAGFVIGAALTLTSQVVYSTYTHAPRLWGLSALEDQQLGGLIMWVFGGFIFVVPILFLVTEWMKQEEGDVWAPGTTREQARLARQTAAKPES
ncbi:MAG: cytochrome c oxidase assembly protein [Gemmatimonadota bacterium]|jgi:putative membrane protein